MHWRVCAKACGHKTGPANDGPLAILAKDDRKIRFLKQTWKWRGQPRTMVLSILFVRLHVRERDTRLSTWAGEDAERHVAITPQHSFQNLSLPLYMELFLPPLLVLHLIANRIAKTSPTRLHHLPLLHEIELMTREALPHKLSHEHQKVGTTTPRHLITQ